MHTCTDMHAHTHSWNRPYILHLPKLGHNLGVLGPLILTIANYMSGREIMGFEREKKRRQKTEWRDAAEIIGNSYGPAVRYKCVWAQRDWLLVSLWLLYPVNKSVFFRFSLYIQYLNVTRAGYYACWADVTCRHDFFFSCQTTTHRLSLSPWQSCDLCVWCFAANQILLRIMLKFKTNGKRNSTH